jgi:hypothetical protein
VHVIGQLLAESAGNSPRNRAEAYEKMRLRFEAMNAGERAELAAQQMADIPIFWRGDNSFWRADNPGAWIAGVVIVAGTAVLVVATGGAVLEAVAFFGPGLVLAGAAAGGIEGGLQVAAAANLEHRSASISEYVFGVGLGAVFGAAHPIGAFSGLGGSLAGGLLDRWSGGQFLGRGLQVGGLAGGLIGGSLGSGLREASARYGTTSLQAAILAAGGTETLLTKAALHALPQFIAEGAGAGLGAGIASHYGDDPLLGANFGSMGFGLLAPVALRALRATDGAALFFEQSGAGGTNPSSFGAEETVLESLGAEAGSLDAAKQFGVRLKPRAHCRFRRQRAGDTLLTSTGRDM